MMKFYRRDMGGSWWNYTVPHTGVNIARENFHALKAAIRAHLDANGFVDAVITDDELEDHCAKNAMKTSPSCCFELSEAPISERKITLSDVVRFTRTMFLNWTRGGKRVEQAEADRRAAICATCPMNAIPEGCGTCSGSGAAAAIIGMVSGDMTTTSDQRLHTCLVCGCFNKAQVWVPLNDLRDGMGEKLRRQLPDNCWKK